MDSFSYHDNTNSNETNDNTTNNKNDVNQSNLTDINRNNEEINKNGLLNQQRKKRHMCLCWYINKNRHINYLFNF